MAPPQLFIKTKTLELEKQPDNKSYEDFEPENKQVQAAEKKDKQEENESNDPAEDSDENGENRKAKSLPILTYVVSPILVLTGLAIAFVGVSSNKNDSLLSKCYDLIFPGLSLGRRIYLRLFLRAWPSPVLTCHLLHCPRSWDKVGNATVLPYPCLCHMG